MTGNSGCLQSDPPRTFHVARGVGIQWSSPATDDGGLCSNGVIFGPRPNAATKWIAPRDDHEGLGETSELCQSCELEYRTVCHYHTLFHVIELA